MIDSGGGRFYHNNHVSLCHVAGAVNCGREETMNCPYCEAGLRIGKKFLTLALLLAVPVLTILALGVSAPAGAEGSALNVVNNQGYINLQKSREAGQERQTTAGDDRELGVYLENWQYTGGSGSRR
jgi:hypothetical protein